MTCTPNVDGEPEVWIFDCFHCFEVFDEFGHALAAGDFNNDGRDDLVVGVPNESLSDAKDNLFLQAGAVHVIYGASGGLSATAKPDEVWHQNSASIEDTLEDYTAIGDPDSGGDSFGFSVASG